MMFNKKTYKLPGGRFCRAVRENRKRSRRSIRTSGESSPDYVNGRVRIRLTVRAGLYGARRRLIAGGRGTAKDPGEDLMRNASLLRHVIRPRRPTVQP